MKALNPRAHMVKEGSRSSYELTDPEYYDKYLARLVNELRACSPEWLDTFLTGIDERDWKALKEAGYIKDKERPKNHRPSKQSI